MKIFGTTIKFYEDINSLEFYIFWGAVLLVFIIILIIGIILDKRKNLAKIMEAEKVDKLVADKPISTKIETPVMDEVKNVQKGDDTILIAKNVEADSTEDFRKAFFKKEEKVEEPVKTDTNINNQEQKFRQIDPPTMIKMPTKPITNNDVAELSATKGSPKIPEPVKLPEDKEIETNNDYQALLELNKLSGKYDVNEEDLKQFKPIELFETKKVEMPIIKTTKNEGLESRSNLDEVARKMEYDLENNKSISLTRFEKNQEEDAVISYDELIKNAKKEEEHVPIMVKTTTNRVIDVEPLLDNVEDIDDFLRQLKDIRNNM